MRWTLDVSILLLLVAFAAGRPPAGRVATAAGRSVVEARPVAGRPRKGRARTAREPPAKSHGTMDAGTQSMEALMEQHLQVVKKHPNMVDAGSHRPLWAVKFGTPSSRVMPGQFKDVGALYTEQQTPNHMHWGWNCDLNALEDHREREGTQATDDLFNSFVIPDRHANCNETAAWRISVPPGEYTVRVSGADPETKQDSAAGCVVAGVRLGDLSPANKCDTDDDDSCYVLPLVSVRPGLEFALQGDYKHGCGAVNYIEFYRADNATAVALSTFNALEVNVVNEDFAEAEPELDAFLRGLANEQGDVIAASVNAGYIDFGMNWFCSISKMNITNVFLIATDTASYNWFNDLGYPTYRVLHGPGSQKLPEQAMSYGTVAYQELILKRTQLVNKVLQLGYNILLCDVDAVWLHNPVPYLSHDFDIQAQPEVDGRLCGGFLFMLSTPKMQALWQKITTMHTKMVREAEQRHKLKTVDQSEQELLLKLLPAAKLRVKRLDSNLFPPGLKFFGPMMTMKSRMKDADRERVVVVHNNYVIGRTNKQKRFEHFGLWFINGQSDNFTCRSELVGDP